MTNENRDRLILVTGATGKQGGAALQQLKQRGFRLRALTRDPDKPAARSVAGKGVEVVAGDFNKPDSLAQALEGAYGVFAVSTQHEQGIAAEIAQGLALADAARYARVTHYIYTSVGGAERDTGVPHFDSKYKIEQHARGLGFPYLTFLRPVFFMENWLSMKDMIDGGAIFGPLRPETKLQQVSVSDIGAFAALAFENRDFWRGRALELAGDELSMTETAAALTLKAGHEVRYQQVPWDQFERNAGHEMTLMFRWFEEHGYEADIPALRREYKALASLDKWLTLQGGLERGLRAGAAS